MITTLDTQSWSRELVTGNAEFIEANGLVYVISNVRADNTFAVLVSEDVPPAPGPGSQFTTAAEYTFRGTNSDFDPVAAYDPTTGLIHIIGTRDNSTGFGSTFGLQFGGVAVGSIDLIKFTFDTATNILTGPTLLQTGTRLRQAYDICVLNNQQHYRQPDTGFGKMFGLDFGGTSQASHTLVACALTDAIPTFAPEWIVADWSFGQVVQYGGVYYTCIASVFGFGNGFGQDFGNGNTLSPNLDPVHWMAIPSHRLVSFELDQNDTIIESSYTTLQSSPLRSGSTYSNISLVCYDGLNADLYYTQQPKNVTFKDVTVQMFNATRNVPNQIVETDTVVANAILVSQAADWVSDILVQYHTGGGHLTPVPSSPQPGQYTVVQGQYVFNAADNGKVIDVTYGTTPLSWGAAVELTSFVGRHTDKRLTVFADTLDNRYGAMVFWTQLNHPEGLIGNVLLGYQPVGGVWNWKITNGSVANGSFVQATLSLSMTMGLSLNYLLEPFEDVAPPEPVFATSWPLHVATVNLSTLGFTDVPGFYNNQNFTWLRGTKSIIDDQSLWGVVGERQGTPNLPVWVSAFNVPPVAQLIPSSVTVHRGVPFLFDARGTTDADNDPITYIWSESDPDTTDITLTPLANTFGQGQGFGAEFGQAFGVGQAQGPEAVLLVDPAVGGAERNFIVGVAAIDLQADLVTPRHNYLVVNGIQIINNQLIVLYSGTDLPLIAAGERIMLWGLQNATFLNDVVVTVTESGVGTDQGFGLDFGNEFGISSFPTPYLYFTAVFDIGFGYGFGSNFGFGTNAPFTYLVADSGYAIRDPQFATSNVFVPFNAAPTIEFTENPISVGRYTNVTITPVYTGVTDPDDNTTYLWEQLAGTPVNFVNGNVFPTLVISPLGVNVNGETLTFKITVDDGVNPVIFDTVSVIVAAHTANYDTRLLARSNWTDVASLSAVQINSQGVMTLFTPAPNPFIAGQTLSFVNVQNAVWLNGTEVPILNVTDTTIVAKPPLGAPALYMKTDDAGTLSAPISIINRNSPHTWSPIVTSAMASNLVGIHRTSVLDGTDRYILVSTKSVLVYGGVAPDMFVLRRLLIPDNDGGNILDAFHTEADETFVLTDHQILYRYSTAPLINTDNPDARIDLTGLSDLSFEKLTGTSAYANIRVLVFSGEQGAILMQLNATTLALQGFIELTTTGNPGIYGANNVQFIRFVNMESIRQGRVLIGTIMNATAGVATLNVTNNVLAVVAPNNFRNGDAITFTGNTGLTALNGFTGPIYNASSTGFEMNFTHADYPTAPDTGTAEDLSYGTSFETLLDLQHKVVLGTWDKSKLRNQFVVSGEILFETEDSYVGRPTAPELTIPVVSGNNVTLTWVQKRPDLVNQYRIEYSTDKVNWSLLQLIGAGSIQSFSITNINAQGTVYFRVTSFGMDGFSPTSNVQAAFFGGLSAPGLGTIQIVEEIQFGVFFGSNFGGSGQEFAIELFWADAAPDFNTIDGYTIQMSVDGAAYTTLGTSQIQSFVTPPLAGGHTYSFQVAAFVPSQNKNTAYSQAQAITVPLAIPPQIVPSGQVGLVYSAQLQVKGGVPPYTWVTRGDFGFGNIFGFDFGENLGVPGLNLNTDGTITGTPDLTGVYPFSVQVTDSAQPFSLVTVSRAGFGFHFGENFGLPSDLSITINGPGFGFFFNFGFGEGNGLGDGFGHVFGDAFGIALNP